MMTLRELVNSTDIERTLRILQEFHKGSWSYLTEEVYKGVIDELRNLPYEDGGWKSIVVVLGNNDDFDVFGLLKDPCKDGILTALDLVDWSEFVEVPVESESEDDAWTLAAVLFEITFYGFSREAIRKRRDELIKASGEVKLEDCVTWREVIRSLERGTED